MDKETFKQHLIEATARLADFTRTLCYNNIPDNYKYRITPNTRTVDKDDKHLTSKEIEILKSWNHYQHCILAVDDVVGLLHHDDTVPVWIDMTVYEAKYNLTIIDLLCSRRLRGDSELYHQGQIMPFHLQVAIPPENLKVEKDGKFDVNWKKRRDDKAKRKSLLTRLKQLFVPFL